MCHSLGHLLGAALGAHGHLGADERGGRGSDGGHVLRAHTHSSALKGGYRPRAVHERGRSTVGTHVAVVNGMGNDRGDFTSAGLHH